MEKEIFWEVFRDTGDPLCWLLTRADSRQEKRAPEKPERREAKPSVPR